MAMLNPKECSTDGRVFRRYMVGWGEGEGHVACYVEQVLSRQGGGGGGGSMSGFALLSLPQWLSIGCSSLSPFSLPQPASGLLHLLEA